MRGAAWISGGLIPRKAFRPPPCDVWLLATPAQPTTLSHTYQIHDFGLVCTGSLTRR
jgi:hypothetical protein